MELFVGLSIPRSISEALQKIQDEMRVFDNLGRYELAENYHLTLRYIGEVSQINPIINSLQKIQHKRFDLTLYKLGMFINPDGNVLWVNVAENDQLHGLQRLVVNKLLHSDSQVESIPFVPHISLAYGSDPTIGEHFSSLIVPPMSFSVTSFHLYVVDRFATGYRYRIIQTFQLT